MRQVSADDMIAPRKPAMMKPFRPIGISIFKVFGNAAPGGIPGNCALANSPKKANRKERGMTINAAHRADLRATS